MKYRTRPVEVEARQWDGTKRDAMGLITWIEEHGGRATYRPADDAHYKHIIMKDEYGIYFRRVDAKDWAVYDSANQSLRVVSNSEFVATYEPVEG